MSIPDPALILNHLERTFGQPRRQDPTPESSGPHGQIAPSTSSRSRDLLNELVSTILSQNTNDRNSSRAFRSLKNTFPSWEAVADADPEDLIAAIRSGGLANTKARRIQAILKEIRTQQGEISLQFLEDKTTDQGIEFLTALHGVGLKTAACVLLFGMNRDVCPVDTHVHRTCNRLGLVNTRQPDQTYDHLKEQIPTGRAYRFHVSLIRLGKRICKAQSPQCQRCPLQEICPSAFQFGS